MLVIKNVDFFRISAVQKNNKNFGLAFYLDQGALNDTNKDTVENHIQETVETETGFEEIVFVTGVPSKGNRPYGSDVSLIGNFVKALSDDKYGNSRPRRILESFGKGVLTVQCRYNSEGFLSQIFIGSKQSFIKNVVNRSVWEPASNEVLAVIQHSWKELFKHFYITKSII